ncbi:MAG: 30S ribosomal protein S19e [archaeon]
MAVFEVNAIKFNEKLAAELKKIKEFEAPEWTKFVKTSVAKERPPQDPDFWYKRAASILRQIYIKGVVGVNRLKTRYGGRYDRGSKPDVFRKGSGKIIRTILQQAEAAGLLEKIKGKKTGRKLTKKGVDFLESTAREVK